MAQKEIKWFARGGGIAKAGPFDTQIQAVNSMRLVTETDEEYRRATAGDWRICKSGFIDPRSVRPQFKGGFPDDIFVWPEEVPAEPRKRVRSKKK